MSKRKIQEVDTGAQWSDLDSDPGFGIEVMRKVTSAKRRLVEQTRDDNSDDSVDYGISYDSDVVSSEDDATNALASPVSTQSMITNREKGAAGNGRQIQKTDAELRYEDINTRLLNTFVNKRAPNVEKLRTMTQDEFEDQLEELLERWKINGNAAVSFAEILQLGLDNFQLHTALGQRREIETAYTTNIVQAMALKRYIILKEIETEIHPIYEMPYTMIVNKILEVVHNVYRAMNHFFSASKATSRDYDFSMNDDNYIFRFAPILQENLNEHQILLLYLKNQLYEDDYRKHHGDIYGKSYNEDNQFTYYWERVCSIEEYIARKSRLEYSPLAWSLKTKKPGMIKFVKEHLIDGEESELPKLIRYRWAYSFANGVYLTRIGDSNEDYFHYYDSEEPLPEDIATCQYFDMAFHNDEYNDQMTNGGQDEPDWYRIQTPHLQKVLEFQYHDNPEKEEIIRWFYILMGRLLYKNGEHDNWQVMPVLQGLAATGKGLIISYVIKSFYEASDIGIMNNQIDEKFGIYGFVDKKIWLGLDLDRKWKMDKTTLLSMISAEDLAANVKYRPDPLNVWNWPVPGILATNEEIGFNDSGGSISRRLITFVFKNKVPESQKDVNLGKKIKMEIAEIIKKCNLAYLDAISKYGSKSIHSVMPSYFTKGKEKLQLETDPIYEFMSNLDLRFSTKDHRRWIPIQVLEQRYKEWCQETGQIRPINFGKCNAYSAIATLKEKYDAQVEYLTRVDDPLISKMLYPRDPNARRHTRNHRAIIDGFDLADNCIFEEDEDTDNEQSSSSENEE